MSVVFCSKTFLIAVEIFCSSRLSLPVELIKLRECVAIFWISDLWSVIFTVFCFLSCRDDLLVLHDFLVEVNLWDSRDLFVKLQLVLPLLNIWDWLAGWIAAGHLHRWLDGLLQPYSVLCTSPRISPCLGRSPLDCFACCWPSSCLACCWLCSSASFSLFLVCSLGFGPLSTVTHRPSSFFDFLLRSATWRCLFSSSGHHWHCWSWFFLCSLSELTRCSS